MKNRVIKCFRRVIVSTLVVSMLVGMGMVSNAKIVPEEEVTGKAVVYEQRADYTNYFNNTAPEVETDTDTGLLFGGWFQKGENDKYQPLTAKPEEGLSNVYAKFVPSRVLSVKCQNSLETTSESTSSSMKVISAVDSLNYQTLGFDMTVVLLDDNGKTYSSEIEIGKATSTKVYNKLLVGSEECSPKDLFGDEAEYISTTWVNNILKKDFQTIVCIKPYWVTLDGTRVEGLTKYAHIADAFTDDSGCRTINVPINLRDTKAVAAGVVTLTSSDKFEVDSIECGRVFGEMDFADKGDGVVRLVGNLAEMTEAKQEAKNDIYANVRFKVRVENKNDIVSGHNFTVTGEDFANIAEEQFTSANYPVWDIAY